MPARCGSARCNPTTCGACSRPPTLPRRWQPVADPQGFLTIRRRGAGYRPAGERVADDRDQALPAGTGLAAEQAGRCMDCGVPFCHGGCPLGNLIPDWNELARTGDWRAASERLHATNNFPELT